MNRNYKQGDKLLWLAFEMNFIHQDLHVNYVIFTTSFFFLFLVDLTIKIYEPMNL